MNERTAARLAWVVLGSIICLFGAAQAWSVKAGSGLDLFLIAVLSFPVAGALVASRRPRNAVGWTMLAIGVVVGLDAVLRIYAAIALDIRPGSLPRPGLALALSGPMWVPLIGLMGTFLILLFPDGRLPSARWRPWAWFCALALIFSFVGILLAPGTFTEQGYPGIRNPLGLEALRPFIDTGLFLVIMSIPIGIAGCAVALIRRFRTARGQERLQLKWFAAAAGVVAPVYLLLMAFNLAFAAAGRATPHWAQVVSNVGIYAFLLFPVAAGVAILKHRLYDIDLIINRTLVYGVLTAALTTVYLLVVTALQGLLRPFAGQSELAVAGSTLVVAGLFRPARVRIQAFIDRRFYRRKYDAARTSERFAAKVRDEVDLDALTAELVSVIGEVMQPKHVSLWLRGAPGREQM